MKCEVDFCSSNKHTAHYCLTHYRQHKNGEEFKPVRKKSQDGLNEKARFYANVTIRNAKYCWEWNGTINNYGYGVMYQYRAKRILAHRMSWIIYKGEIPDDKCILHKCDNRRCVNPDHLFLGSRDDNNKDMVSKGRHNPYGSRTGKTAGEQHGGSKLTEKDVKMIRNSDQSGSELARQLGVSKTTICDIKKRRIWRHIS
jgi:hypothetical protein